MIAERALRRAWVEAVGDPAEGDDDFFARGGDSLAATTVALALRRDLGVELEDAWLYEVPCFADALSDLQRRPVRRRDDGLSGPIERVDGVEHPLSFQQEGLLACTERLGGMHEYRLSYAVGVPAGSLDSGRLRDAVSWLGERHPALRTTVDGHRQRVGGHRVELHVGGCSSQAQVDEARRWVASHHAVEDGPWTAFGLFTGPEEDLLVVASHQMVMDPWSWGLCLRDLAAWYADPGCSVAEPGLSYGDYARWQRQTLTGQVYARHLDFWRGVAAGYPASGVRLPGVLPESPVPPAGPAARLRFTVPAGLTAALRAIGGRSGHSLFHVLLAVFHVAVADWSQAPDVIVGTATANRTQPGTEQVVGFFVNGRFTRSEPSRHRCIGDLIDQVGGQWRAADAHQELHLEKTVFDLGVPDLVNIKFSLNAIPTLEPLPKLAGQDLRQVSLVDPSTSRRHIAVSLDHANGGLTGGLIYRTDLVDPGTVAGLVEAFSGAMDRAVNELGAP